MEVKVVLAQKDQLTWSNGQNMPAITKSQVRKTFGKRTNIKPGTNDRSIQTDIHLYNINWNLE